VRLRWVVLVCSLVLAGPALGSDLIGFVNLGGGPQGASEQSHRSLGLDLNVYQHQRTPRQEISIAVGYTYINSNSGGNHVLHAVSVYPQLRLTPVDATQFKRFLPNGAEPYFLVRFLGPSYISERSLGNRMQENHFTFQAGVGVGFQIAGSGGRDRHLTLMWKHFSNANLFDENDGIDVPVVLSFGMRL
jgi:hypothetical protein